MTPDEQDLVVSEIMKYYEWLPESMRPNIYKAKLNENLPVDPVGSGWIPKDGILLVLKKALGPGDPGSNATYDNNKDGKIEAALLMFRIPFQNNAQMRELGAPLFCVNDDFSGVYSGKSPFDSQLPLNVVMPADIKAIYLNALFPQGSDFNKYWKMPYVRMGRVILKESCSMRFPKFHRGLRGLISGIYKMKAPKNLFGA
jgi:hypothetical protein